MTVQNDHNLKLFHVSAKEACEIKIGVVGENLVDLFKVEDKFEAHPGGSPLNVAVGLVRLGENVSYITRFSYDFFAKMLIETLKSENVDLSFCSFDKSSHTTLAFAFVDENKIPTFEIWNKCTSDSAMSDKDLSKVDLKELDVAHFGSILLATPASKAVLDFVEKAKDFGKFITFDPNYRPRVAENEEKYLNTLRRGWNLANVVKCSYEDVKIIFDLKNMEEAVNLIKEKNVPTFLTMGSEGAYLITKDNVVHIQAYKTNVVDTTGCGDAFAAGVIYELCKHGLSMEDDVLVKAGQVGSAVAAIAAQKIGAITSFAHVDDVKKFMRGVN